MSVRALTIPSPVVPLVRSLLVGPAAYAAAREAAFVARPKPFEMSDDRRALADAASVLFHGIERATGQDFAGEATLDIGRSPSSGEAWEAAGQLSARLDVLHSSHYAAGREALRVALGARSGRITLEPERAERIRRAAKPMGVIDNPARRRVGIGSEREMGDVLLHVGQTPAWDAESRRRFFQAFAIDPNGDVRQMVGALQGIWSDPSPAHAPGLRTGALELWLDELLCRVFPKGGVRALADVGPAAGLLFTQSLDSRDADLRKRSREVLYRLLTLEGNPWVVSLLPKIAAHFRYPPEPSGRHPVGSLLSLYGGLLALHGEHASAEGGDTAAVVATGALLLLDLAANPLFDEALRVKAFQYALYAVEKFVPDGAQVLFDWLRWQVEVEPRPMLAVHYARTYAWIFTDEGIAAPRPPTWQQWQIGCTALRRRDLPADARADLWNALAANQPFPWQWALRLARWRGPYADPRPSPPAASA